MKLTKSHNGEVVRIVAYDDAYNQIGSVQVFDAGPREMMVGTISVESGERASGVGTQLYREALKEACSSGKMLVSDSHRSPYAEAFWRKQARKRRAKCLERGKGTVYMQPIEELRRKLMAECREVRFDYRWAERCADARLKAMTATLPKPKISEGVWGKSATWPCYRWGVPREKCSSSLEAAPSAPFPRWAKWAALGGAALLVLGGGAAAVTFGPGSSSSVNRDPAQLLPAFRRKVATLLGRMRARGYDAILWEGYRSPARAAQKADEGVGIKDSMHSYGAAADIVSESRLWNAPADFWAALGQEAEALGLTWGGRFSRVDKPHVQLVSVGQQAGLRRMSSAERQMAFAGLPMRAA